ncbi:MAG: YkgJ family cysteine cluster protein [Epsilonproteobacteria bacterium]|nr:MAG: YkgJ family cysteine cluster protein [Campylobacterota bacterium]
MQQEGYPYVFDPSACAACEGRCCTGESGNIFVRPEEIRALAVLTEMEENDFRTAYLVKRGYKFSLKEKRFGVSYDCIFYERKYHGCSVYEARPVQCRTFPFWDYYKTRVDELKLECQGISDA